MSWSSWSSFAAPLKSADGLLKTNVPAVRQRLIRLPSDLDGHMRVKRAHVPIQEPMPEEPHSANARDTR